MDQPDVILIMADQLTAFALPSYGHPVVEAPHITSLADEGVLFDNAYCNSPLCAPSRASMMTGRLPSRIGAYDNACEFPASLPTLAHALRGRGYLTCLSGKMHFVGPDQLHGFEERLTPDIYPAEFAWIPNWDEPEERIDWWYHNMLSVKQAGVAEATNQLDFDDEVAFHAARFLKNQARSPGRRPFFLTVSFTHPHDPYAIRAEYWDRYADREIALPRVGTPQPELDDPHSRRLRRAAAMDEADISDDDVRRARRAYYGAVSYVDDHVGQLLATLRAFGLSENTVVLFTADHGELLGERGLWYKMHLYEWAVRIPLIVHAPGRFAARRVSDPVSLVDLLPTLADLGRPPGGAEMADLDGNGRSLLPILEGRGAADREVVAEYLAEGAVAPILMIRRGALKFIWSEPDPPLLFDLERDPDELDNLAARSEGADLARSLQAEVGSRWDVAALHQAVLSSQRTRRLARDALSHGRRTPWEWNPALHHGGYVSGEADLNQLERFRRYPPPPK
jgi:choline-sulfatase